MPAPRIEVETHAQPLSAVRRVLDGADEALLAAFVQQRGVDLLQRQLRAVSAGRPGSTTSQGRQAARDGGLGVRVLNPSRGTFHPKLYVARHGDRIAAAIGSANLTSGLVANVEVFAVLHGSRLPPELRRLWELTESWWEHVDAVDWSPEVPAQAEVLHATSPRPIEAALAVDREVLTLADRRPNWVRDVNPGRRLG